MLCTSAPLYVPTVNQKLRLKGLPFQSMLRKKLYDKALEFLKSQTPSGVHLALEQVGPMASGDEEELKEGQGHSWKRHLLIFNYTTLPTPSSFLIVSRPKLSSTTIASV